MKKIRTFFYAMIQSFKNIGRNMFMVFASVIVVFSVLLIAGVLIESGIFIGSVMRQFSDRAEIQINFKYYVTDAEAREYYEALKDNPVVKKAVFVTREENLKKILEYHSGEGEAENLLENYKDSERLKFASIEIQLNEYENGKDFVEDIKATVPDVESVKDIVGTIEKLELIKFWVIIGTVAAVIVMTGLSLLLIFNTVKLTVLARRREIEIMKNIGATDAYIVTPFVMEGVMTGLLGAVLAFFTLAGIYGSLFGFIRDVALEANIRIGSFTEAGGPVILVSFLLFGAFTGFVASIFAARRHMKV